MAAAGVGGLRVLASARPAAEDPLPLAERAAYQRQLIEGFLTSRRATVGASSVHHARTALRANLLPWLEAQGQCVWDVRPEDLDQWAVALKHAVRARTHQQYFIQVELFFAWLVQRKGPELQARLGVQLVNPVDRFNRARRLPREERLVPVPREEAITFFLAARRAAIDRAPSDVKWLQACRNYVLWMVLNWAGLRRAEVAILERDDVDLVAGTLRVREGKGGKGRLVHLQPPLASTLRWYLHEVRPQAPGGWKVPLLFLNARRGALHPDAIRNLLCAEQAAAGLPLEDRFTCHGFRRAYATRLYKALRAQGFRDPLVYVKEQLGHEYLSTTQRYCQLDDDYHFFLVQEAAAALTQHFDQAARATAPNGGTTHA